jgi:TRAP transporter TAXI family solute receptor
MQIQAETIDLSKPINLRIATGAAGGIFYIQAGVMSEVLKKAYPGSQINVVLGGAVGNIGLVSNGVADIGLTHLNMYPLALKGAPPYDKKYDNVSALMRHGYYAYIHIIVSEATGIKSLQEIKDKKYPIKIASTTKAGASYWDAINVLGLYGITPEDIKNWDGKVLMGSMNDAVNWFRDGQINAWGGSGQLPANVPIQVSEFTKIRVLSVDKEHAQKMVQKMKGAGERIIPAGTYPRAVNGNEDVQTIASLGGIVVRRDLPDDVVYKITKAFCEAEKTFRETPGMKEFDPKIAWKDIGILHPGAEKYFKEQGWMK